MNRRALFEVSWEVANKVGGIHTVLATRAPSLVERFGDDYFTIGPWLLADDPAAAPFEPEPGHEDFAAACRELGLDVRVGRWRIPGAPRLIQVGFSGLLAEKDAVLAGLWEDFRVDSLAGGWDYVEPVLFGWAAAQVIELWWRERLAPLGVPAVAQCHEWLTGSCLLRLKKELPEVGTVFTTHATVLGRALAAAGLGPAEGLAGGVSPEQAATANGVRAKHSLESVCAAEADVFTTVSEVTADEAELLLGRRPEPVTPNGIDLEVVDAARAGVPRAEARDRLRRVAEALLGRRLDEAAFLCTSGRYEFRNKGFDLLLRALARLDRRPGRPLVLFALVPAGVSGPVRPLLERLAGAGGEGALGTTTHNLIDPAADPIQRALTELDLGGGRVAVVQVPVYLHGDDGVLGLRYEAALQAMDLSCFPSFYEPWGYTPVESLAVGVPTVTSDLAGFGRWARANGLDAGGGVHILARAGRADEEAEADLAELLESALARAEEPERIVRACREAAASLAWPRLLGAYEDAWERAAAAAAPRAEAAAPRPARPVPVRPPAEEETPRLIRFDVAATLPEPLASLEELAGNFCWSWDAEAPALFAELSPQRWERCGHNPTRFLREVFARDLAAKAADADYVARLQAAVERQRRYLAEPPPDLGAAIDRRRPVAYFCFEFGVHESLRIYSGGLGVLAGDHLKSASDLNLPLVGVGLYYRRGYLRQGLDQDGNQVSIEEDNDPRDLPLAPVFAADGEPLRIPVHLPGREVLLRAWRADVGRVPLFLLDADLEENRAEDRALTHRLYGGGQETRLIQEILLGKGGVRLLAALGLEPSVLHLNEGHAAFAPLELASHLVHEQGHTFAEALERVRACTAFTTHTPVPAGHDVFGEDLIRRHFSNVETWLGASWETFLALGDPHRRGSFNMTHLACRLAGFVNGVSRLHGEVSRALLHEEWPGMTEDEVPVRHVTNGVHLATWTDPELARLLGAGPRPGADAFAAAESLSDEELWAFRERARRRLLDEIRRRVRKNFLARQDSPRLMGRILDGLDPEAMILGFARRFAPYKRALLLFQDRERLLRLLADRERPLLLLFAGKAHPADDAGKALLREVVQLSRSPEFAGRLVFLEDYDLELARLLVRGVDVWLNNPTRPLEASGTSGMKVAANGGLNLSVLDGWWLEGADGRNGWSLQQERSYPDQELQDQHDNASLLTLLEEEILPLFHRRDERGLPTAWLERVRHSLLTLPPVFCTDRMVMEYRDRAYLPLAERGAALAADGGDAARARAAARADQRRRFAELRIVAAEISDTEQLRTGDRLAVRVEIDPAGLTADDLLVELVLGHENGPRRLELMETVPLAPADGADGRLLFAGSHELERSGRWGYGLRVRLRPRDEFDLDALRLARWA